MLACTKGKPEVVKVLLHHGADVTQREKEMDLAGQEQETLNSLELAIENGRRCKLPSSAVKVVHEMYMSMSLAQCLVYDML